MKQDFEYFVKMVLLCFALSGCSTLHDAIFERESKLAPLQSAMLGQTTRDQIIKQLGPPQEIDERRFDTFQSEVFFYYDQSVSNNGSSRIQYQFLACEFNKGALTGYVFHGSGEARAKDFDEKERSKLVKGKTSRREVESLLGIPSGRALLPSTLTLAALDLKLAGVPFPLAKLPEGAKEVWQYYTQNFDDALRKTSQKSLSLFFDENGLFIGSYLFQELMSKTSF